MTQTGININNDNEGGRVYNQGNARTYEDKKTKVGITTGNINSVIDYKYDRKKGDNNTAVVDGFEEYMRQQQEIAREKGIDEETKEKEQKEAEREIASNLTEEEIRQLTRMGIDLESATLRDIMGMVNTLRGEQKRKESAELMARISMSDGDVDGMIVTGGTVKQAGSGIELDNIDASEVVQEKSEDDMIEITKEDIIYLIKNNVRLDKDSLYKAHFSGLRLAEEKDNSLYETMKPQLERVIMQAGFLPDEKTMGAAKSLLCNDVFVTTDNVRAYMTYEQYIGKQISDIDQPDELTDKTEAGLKLFREAAGIDPKAAYEMTDKKIEITIASAFSFCSTQYNADKVQEYVQKLTGDMSLQAVSNMRRLEEIRLSMTVDAANRLARNDINIDTRELSVVVSKLREIENEMIADSLSRNNIPVTNENISTIYELSKDVKTLAERPAAVIGLPLRGVEFTVRQMNAAEVGATQLDVTQPDVAQPVDGAYYEKVKRSYEAVGTSVRADMGDSITKAFANVDAILSEMNIEINYENQRAVRILGYNQIEINEQSIKDIVDYDRQVNELIDNFYPEAVLGIIKDGINPLDVPIEELNNIIRERKYNAGVSEAKNFAAYLRDMESMEEVSAAERESYIGIYRVMERLAKSGDREAGFIYNNKAMLTVRNLIAAMRSKRASGIDARIDDDFGMLDELSVKGKKMDAQIEGAFSISDEARKAINDEAVYEYAKEYGIDMSIVNANSIYHMLYETGGIYQLASEVISKMSFKTDTANESVDEASENIEKSLLGDTPDIEIIPENILNNLTSAEEMSLKYDDIRDKIIETMYHAAAAGVISSSDISTIKTVTAGFNILSNMARNDRYQLPYRTKDGMGVMNLVINHDADKKGNIQIDFKNETNAHISARLYLSAGGELSGEIIADTSEENEKLQRAKMDLQEQMRELGYNPDKISFGAINREYVNEQGAAGDGNNLYRAAVDMVRLFSRI